nr:LRR receptor-like serine/threonine-protein kinase FLS2 [Setaria viridis]
MESEHILVRAGGAGGTFPAHCNWTGVACDGAGHVTSIQLLETGLRGTLTSFLGNISTLQVLDLTSNRFGGAVPPQLGRLGELEQLVLYDNNFTDGIPPELGDPRSLQLLDLGNNTLHSGIPGRLCNCSVMWAFGAVNNNLTGALPDCIGDLSNLRFLVLFNNGLDGDLPPSFTKLTQMEALDLSSGATYFSVSKSSLIEFLVFRCLDFWLLLLELDLAALLCAFAQKLLKLHF